MCTKHDIHVHVHTHTHTRTHARAVQVGGQGAPGRRFRAAQSRACARHRINPEQVVFASNTMTLPIQQLTAHMDHAYRQRAVGLRFLAPCWFIDDVELTSPSLVDAFGEYDGSIQSLIGGQQAINAAGRLCALLALRPNVLNLSAGQQRRTLTHEEVRTQTHVGDGRGLGGRRGNRTASISFPIPFPCPHLFPPSSPSLPHIPSHVSPPLTSDCAPHALRSCSTPRARNRRPRATLALPESPSPQR